MFRHVGLLTLNDEATTTNRNGIAEALRALPGQIAGLEKAEVCTDAGLSEGNAHLMFTMTFDSKASWEAYRTHAAHVAVLTDHIKPVLASKTFVQIDESL
ncbi:Dabb family protein [Rhodococcus sp. IEGM 1379]|uniref:Dabb family protein n=1 Tax=Rhodococcus sp. IEGM 1379 TaxID=3047086 RepID=UPI0024B86BAA|nr:Dabb family protein [Rhodococcus sp. IEGM 1379]MDI9915333.1 Dabb family protein [Rhodococcus sp. IEGM 1379]